ncbi:hypothetical protein V7S43_014812 [Phytophthora oleae]|uniref:Uncharacterized protein n=1 Tax=Phytophthora oleae TaxID=2107226 RepID=A0ABD3F0G4_9STRA
MFDHLTNSVSGTNSPRNPSSKTSSRRVSSTPVRTGMSVMELAQLLKPAKAPKSSSVVSNNSTKALQHWKTGSTNRSLSPDTFALDEEVDDELERQDADRKQRERKQKLEKGFVNYVYNPPRELKPGQFAPPDQTTAQLIDKYRKLAVGKMPDTL